MRKMVLEKSGYTVLSAASGDQALKLLRSAHVDLVLSDHYLRGELGTAIAAKIKALKPDIPVLIISGSADALDETEHVDGIISKMDEPTSLLVSIARALGL
jgi:two-component system, OmpR family, response regulator